MRCSTGTSYHIKILLYIFIFKFKKKYMKQQNKQEKKEIPFCSLFPDDDGWIQLLRSSLKLNPRNVVVIDRYRCQLQAATLFYLLVPQETWVERQKQRNYKKQKKGSGTICISPDLNILRKANWRQWVKSTEIWGSSEHGLTKTG